MAMAREKARVTDLSKIRKVYLTPGGYESLKEELAKLEGKKPELSRKIGLTASFGDLPENHAWDAAKEEEAFLNGRIAEIRAILRNAEVIKPISSGKVGLGSKVILECDSKETVVTVVDPLEPNTSSGNVSHDSPFGKMLLGKKVGEEFTMETPVGAIAYRVLSIR